MTGAVKNLVGVRVGWLTVTNHCYNGNASSWKCKCDCGEITVVTTGNINNKTIKSCGCQKHSQNARIGLARRGVESKNPLTGKFETNSKAKDWSVVNKALGITLTGRNLSNMIRDNEAAFDPRDLKWEKHSCRASQGLRSLFLIDSRTGKSVGSWKGWTAIRKATHETKKPQQNKEKEHE